MSSGLSGSMSKRDENRRTLTDFKIIAFEIESLSWKWGEIPPPPEATVKEEEETESEVGKDETSDEKPSEEEKTDMGDVSKDTVDTDVKTEPADLSTSSAKPPAGSVGASMARMRIYFHTPPSPDDARPIPLYVNRKGKRKKGDDEDAEADGSHRSRPPPAGPKGSESVNGDAHGTDFGGAERGSVAPSVTETTSEGDWLMAAIAADANGDDGADAEDDLDAEGEEDAEGDYDDYESTQAEGHYPGHSQTGELWRTLMVGRTLWAIHED